MKKPFIPGLNRLKLTKRDIWHMDLLSHPHRAKNNQQFEYQVGLTKALDFNMLKWLNGNTQSEYSLLDCQVGPKRNLAFKDARDAVLFKLTWIDLATTVHAR